MRFEVKQESESQSSIEVSLLTGFSKKRGENDGREFQSIQYFTRISERAP